MELYTYMAFFVQIVTESLPISSSGHTNLLACLLSSTPLSQAYEYMLYIPTLVIITVFLFRRILFVVWHLMRCFTHIGMLFLFGFMAEIPTGFMYLFLSRVSCAIPLWIGFLVTALLLMSLRYVPRAYQKLSVRTAFLIGCCQGVALIPGISRLAATYAAARWLGLSSRTALLFSWTLMVPIMIVALSKGFFLLSFQEWFLLTRPCTVGVVLVATVFSYMAWLWTWKTSEQGKLWYVGFYMIVPTCVAFFWCF